MVCLWNSSSLFQPTASVMIFYCPSYIAQRLNSQKNLGTGLLSPAACLHQATKCLVDMSPGQAFRLCTILRKSLAHHSGMQKPGQQSFRVMEMPRKGMQLKCGVFQRHKPSFLIQAGTQCWVAFTGGNLPMRKCLQHTHPRCIAPGFTSLLCQKGYKPSVRILKL